MLYIYVSFVIFPRQWIIFFILLTFLTYYLELKDFFSSLFSWPLTRLPRLLLLLPIIFLPLPTAWLPSQIYHFNTPISLKLNDDNFFVWKQQVLTILRCLELMHFLDGNKIPPKFLHNQNNESLNNFVYRNYHKQDQLLVAWLFASMSSALLTKMVGLDSSAEIWKHLITYYASYTRAMIKKFCLLLKTLKNDKFISTYINNIKKIVDSLA